MYSKAFCQIGQGRLSSFYYTSYSVAPNLLLSPIIAQIHFSLLIEYPPHLHFSISCLSDIYTIRRPKFLFERTSVRRDTGGIRTPNLLGRNQRHYPIVLRYQLVILFCSRALFLPDCDAKVGLIFELAIPKPYFFYLFFLDLCHFSLKTQQIKSIVLENIFLKLIIFFAFLFR